MATAAEKVAKRLPPLLASGDRLSQPEFHRRYRLIPDDVKAELVGGIVYMASPLSWSHGNHHPDLNAVLCLYASGRAGLAVGDSVTTILGYESEPQPDLMLRILPEYGGRSAVNSEGFIEGPPELLAEIAVSSRSMDLHLKKDDYLRAGVLEYIVLCVEEREFHWFSFKSRRKIVPDSQGISRSRIFPGLWINVASLWAHNTSQLIETIQKGLASSEHAAFVRRLRSSRAKGS